MSLLQYTYLQATNVQAADQLSQHADAAPVSNSFIHNNFTSKTNLANNYKSQKYANILVTNFTICE